jgi:hydrogenase/urease accessory protein HupE
MNRRTAFVALVAALMFRVPASGHLVTTGLGPFYDGISHLLVSPDDLVPVLAVALLAGVNGAPVSRRMLWVLTVAWLAGGLAGTYLGGPAIPSAVLSVTFLLVGLLISWGCRLSPALITSIAAPVGILHGWLDGLAIAESRRDVLSLAGTVATEVVIASIVASTALALTRGWARIAVRVAGSWVAAIGLLMLGWSLHAGR